MNPKILIVIVNYKVGPLVVDCLKSLSEVADATPGFFVQVIDNDSRDGSQKLIADAINNEDWHDWASVAGAGGNIGFAAGNNLGIRLGLQETSGVADYFLLLNPDTLVRRDAIRLLLEFMEEHPDVGLAGGRSEDPDTTPQHCCFRFPNALNELASNAKLGPIDRLFRKQICRVPISDENHQIDWVSGAFLIIRREVVEQIGLMDEHYFLYFEETDYIRRARNKGWTCWHIPKSRIVHLVGFSSGVTIRHKRPGRKPRYWFDSRRRYFLKHHGFIYTAFADFLFMTGAALGRTRDLLLFRETSFPPWFFWDTIRHSVFVRGAHQEPERFESWNTAELETAASK